MTKKLDKILEGSGLSHNKILEALCEIEKSFLETRNEIGGTSMDTTYKGYLPQAIDELDAVLESTEKATQSILGAAEKIEKLASWTDAATGKELAETVTQIYEACNFQDLTGQRVAKVMRAFKEIEQKIHEMVQGLGGMPHLKKEELKELLSIKSPYNNSLISGPQRSGIATEQNEIDNIFNKK